MTLTMQGNTDTDYSCNMIKGIALTQNEVKEGFDKTTGKCVTLAGVESENGVAQAKQTQEECEAVCEADSTCSAFEHTTRDNSCTIFRDTTPLTGSQSETG